MKNALRKTIGKEVPPKGHMPKNAVSKHAKARQQRQAAKKRK
jgi:hypothetical protein